jgi:hypothetical protein
MLTHTDLRPWSCDICGQRFTIKGTLTRHMATHSDDKAHSCHICGRKFKVNNGWLANYVPHMNKTTGTWSTLRWSNYDRTWFSWPDKQEIFILKWYKFLIQHVRGICHGSVV